MTVNRKPEIKKSLPYILKSHTYMVVVVFATWSFARYVVDYYGGTFPNVGLIQIFLDFWKEISALGLGMSVLTTLVEILRKRQ